MPNHEGRPSLVRPPIVALAQQWGIPWWMDRQHLLSRLAGRGWPVVYSDGPLSIWDRHGNRWKAAPLWAGCSIVPGIPGGAVVVDEPGKILSRWPRMSAWDRFVMLRHARRLRGLAARGRGGTDIIAFVAEPRFAPYLDLLTPRWTIFYVFDAWTPEGWTDDVDTVHDPALAENMRLLSERADLIVAVAPSMVRGLSDRAASRTHILPHGVNADAVIAGATAACPADLADIPRPRVSYIGRINPKLDLSLVEAVARRMPDVHWVFVGWLQGLTGQHLELWNRCLALKNVHFLGQKPQQALPAYLHHMDANTLCYRVDGAGYSWRAAFPIKLFEYMAAAKPIISTNLENVEAYADVVDIAVGADEWVDAITRAVESGGVGTCDDRLRIARANTWDARVDLLESWITGLVQGARI